MNQLKEIVSSLYTDAGTTKQKSCLHEELRKATSRIDLTKVPEKHVQALLTQLFSIIKTERIAYLKSNGSTQTVTGNRLGNYGQCLLQLFDSLLFNARFKTIRLFITHLLDILPVVREVLLVPLANLYLRILQKILGLSMHIDHLDHDLWQHLTTFCVNSLECYAELDPNAVDADLEGETQDVLVNSKTDRNEVISLFSCLTSLTSWHAAQLGLNQYGKAKVTFNRLLTLMHHFFRKYRAESTSHVQALVLCRNLLRYASTNDVLTATKITRLLLDVAEKCWLSRLSNARDELLLGLTAAAPFIHLAVTENRRTTQVPQFAQVMAHDLLTRPERLCFNLYDIRLHSPSITDTDRCRSSVARTVTVASDLNSSATEKYNAFFATKLLAELYLSIGVQDPPIRDAPINKRVKVDGMSGIALIMNLLQNGGERHVLLGLQVLTMMIEHDSNFQCPTLILSLVKTLLTSELQQVQVWAQISLSAAIIRRSNDPFFTKEDHMKYIWHCALRGTESAAVTRSSCHLACAMLTYGHLTSTSIGLSTVTIAHDLPARGPHSISDTSSTFVLGILGFLRDYNYIDAAESRTFGLSWLQSRLCVETPGDPTQKLNCIVPFIAWMTGHSVVVPCVHFNLQEPLLQASLMVDSGRDARSLLMDCLTPSGKECSPDSSTPAVLSGYNDSCIQAAVNILARHARELCVVSLKSEDMSSSQFLESITIILTYLKYAQALPKTTPEHEQDVHALCLVLQDNCAKVSTELSFYAGLVRACLQPLLGLPYTRNTTDRPSMQGMLGVADLLVGTWQQTTSIERTPSMPEDIEFEERQSGGNGSWSFATDAKPMDSFAVDGVFLLVLMLDQFSIRIPSPSNFSTYLLQSDPAWALHCQLIWQMWASLPKVIVDVYALEIMDFLVGKVLHEYRFERYESTFVFVTKFLSAIADVWASDSHGTNGMVARKVFDWLIRIVLLAQLASAMVRQQVIKLCSELLSNGFDTSTQEHPEMTSVSLRTILVSGLGDNDLRAALEAAKVITSIFEAHDMSTYDQIYNDITGALTTATDDETRLRLRVFTLGRLAVTIEVSCSTALYHIIEMTPLSELRPLIKQVIQQIACHYWLEPTRLLRVHHKNLLCNWLSHGSIATFPYQMFCLPDLKTYIKLYAREIVAQAVLFGHAEVTRQVSQEMDSKTEVLVKQAAVRLLAYKELVLPVDNQNLAGYEYLGNSDVLGSNPDECQEFLFIQFELLHDSTEPAKTLSKAGLTDAAHLAEILTKLLHHGPRAPAREVLQTTPRMFINAIRQTRDGLELSTTMRCIRSSLNVLQDGMRVSKWQSLRKIVLILSITNPLKLSSYVMAMILHGFCTLLDSNELALQISIMKLSLYLIRQTKHFVTHDVSSDIAILLHIIRAIQSVHQGSEKLQLLGEMHELVRASSSLLLRNVLGLLQAETLTDFDLIQHILSTTKLVSEILSTKNFDYAQRLRIVLIEILCPCMRLSISDSPEIVSAITLFAGSSFTGISTKGLRVLNHLLGRSLWLNDLIIEEHRDYTTQVFSETYWQVITQELLHSLNGFESQQVELIEQTLALCINSPDTRLEELMSSDIFEILRKFRPPHEMASNVNKLEIDISRNYDEWLRNLVAFLLHYLRRTPFLVSLHKLLLTDTTFSSKIVKCLVLQAVNQSGVYNDDTGDQLGRHFQAVFQQHEGLTRKHIITSLVTCHWLRASGNLHNFDPDREAIVCLSIDSVSIAQAAAHHELLYDAALFLEINGLQCRTTNTSSSVRAVQESVYKKMVEPDSYYGVVNVPSLQVALQRVKYEHGSGGSLPFHAAMSAAERRLSKDQDPELQELIETSFGALGYDSFNLVGRTFDQSTNDAKFESAWRLEQWNLPFTSSPQVQQVMYQTLCKLSRVTWAQSSETDKIFNDLHASFSTCLGRNLPQTKLILGTFAELSEIVNVRTNLTQAIPELLETSWRARATLLSTILGPKQYEYFIAARQVYLNMLRNQIEGDVPLITAQLELLISDYALCSKDRSQQALLNATTFGERLAATPYYSCPFDLRVKLDSMVADVLWQHGDLSTSISMLGNVIERSSGSRDVDNSILSANLLNMGLRSAQGRLEKPKEILRKYLLPAIKYLESDMSASAGELHARFASFCHEQFMSHDQNQDFRRLKRLREEKKQEIVVLDSLQERCNGSEERRKLLAQREKAKSIFEVDDTEYQQVKNTRQVYLRSSLLSFLKAFSLCSSADMLISRCCALWFANNTDTIANNAFSEAVSKVPSHKFLILLHQLLSRISTATDLFQINLTTLLLRLAKDHPYHSLYTMYSVQYSKRSGDQPAKDRARAVARVMQKLTTDGSFEAIATKIQFICSNYVKLAATVIDKKDFPTKDIPFKSVSNYRSFLVQIPTLDLPPLTLTIEPRPSCNYSDVTSISSYEKTFNIAGGISAPKVLKLRLSDGSVHRELVKGGNDDLRQDVVMQQVFVQVDELFKRNRETLKRKLKIRTYKVLPLATNAGVLEWVLNTKPLQDVLQPLHEKYNVGDWAYSECRRAIAEASKKSRQSRIEAYQRVKAHCRPAMRHAFLDMFADPFDWYHAQLAYTRSTAAISIVGHILGLGDRHLHNIILDTKTGDVVHIDLGIAFEQGKTLPIPERVPFRLTRDVVDGMGVLGVEGVFRRCCEFTLDMMRTEQAGITSILDVLKHDPLYSWTLSPLRKHRVQERANEATGQAGVESKGPKLGGEAERALLVVEQKLSSSLSASATVNELIQEATDEENLALIFAGWSAWY